MKSESTLSVALAGTGRPAARQSGSGTRDSCEEMWLRCGSLTWPRAPLRPPGDRSCFVACRTGRCRSPGDSGRERRESRTDEQAVQLAVHSVQWSVSKCLQGNLIQTHLVPSVAILGLHNGLVDRRRLQAMQMEGHDVLTGLCTGLALGRCQDHVVPSSGLLVRLVHLQQREGQGEESATNRINQKSSIRFRSDKSRDPRQRLLTYQ